MDGLSFYSWPAQLQVALGCGYIAYHVAYVGARGHHQAFDVALTTVAFSLVPTFIYFALPQLITGVRSSIIILVAVVASALAGLIWRKWLKRWLESGMRYLDISWANDDPSALYTITGGTRYRFTQIAVQLTDGTWLRCDDASRFNNSPHGPFTIGPDGDVALYLTHVDERDSSKEMTSVSSVEYGDRITYVPASQIQRVTFRLKS